MQNWNLRHIYKIHFLIFWAVFCAFGFKVCNKCKYDPKNFLFEQKLKKISKNAEFHADFESVWKSCKKMHKKSYQQKSLTNISKKLKRAFSRHNFANNFLWCIFSKLFQRIRNQREILRFLIPILNFLINIFFALISTFCKLWLQMRRKRLKKTENLFFWMCLRILLGNHQRVCILLKSLYTTVKGPLLRNTVVECRWNH